MSFCHSSDKKPYIHCPVYHSSLPNGHIFKEPSLNAPPSLDHHQDPSVENLKSFHQNGIQSMEGALETSQDTDLTSHLPTSSEPDPPSTALPSSMPDETTGQSKLSFEDINHDTNPAIETSSSIVQAPISDLREDPQPATSASQQVDDAKDQNITPASAMTNGSPSGADASEQPTQPAITDQQQTESAPVVTSDQMNTSVPSAETAATTTTEIAHHPPVPTPEGAKPEAPIDPAPSPAPPAETHSEQQPSNMIDLPSTPAAAPRSPSQAPQQQPSEDNVMQDVPPSPAKVARPREEDDLQNEPATKRPKTNSEPTSSTEFKKPDPPEVPNSSDGQQPTHRRPDFSSPPTGSQSKAIMRVIGNTKRLTDAKAFLAPVNWEFLRIPSYPTIIKNPMDLGTLEQKLRDSQYPSITALIADFDLIVRNCERFNGPIHTVTLQAHKIKASFDRQIDRISGPEAPDHPPADKKKKPTVSTTEKPPPMRRESRSLPSVAQSPVTPASPQTFALNAQGVPLIRRDSAVDSRPKREIHPPAPRDLPYANQKPKKKKYLGELRFCEHVLHELMSDFHATNNQYFKVAVDPIVLQIPEYFKVIKKPMDLGSVEKKLKQGEYENAKEFEADVRLTFSNCYRFNPPDHLVHQAGKRLEAVFDRELKGKQRWIETNVSMSGAGSPSSSPEASEDEEEEEEEEEQPSSEIKRLQEQIAAMSKQVELMNQKKKSPPAASKKSTKPAAKPDKKAKKAAPAPAAKAKPNAKAAPKSKRIPFVTYEEKQDISNRINDLSESKMAQALKIIRDNMPSLKVRPKISKLSL